MSDLRSTKGYSFEALSHAVIGACIDVQRQLSVHCMEVDYQRALELALKKTGLDYQREVDVPIAYDGVVVGGSQAAGRLCDLGWAGRTAA